MELSYSFKKNKISQLRVKGLDSNKCSWGSSSECVLFITSKFSTTQLMRELTVTGDPHAEHLSIRQTALLRFTEETHGTKIWRRSERTAWKERFGFPAQMFLGYLCCFFLWSVNHCTNSPHIFLLPLIFWCSFAILGEGFVFLFLQPSIYLTFFSFFSIYMYRKTKHLTSVFPAVMTIILSAVNMVNLKPQTEPSWRGEGTKHGS